MNNLHLLLKILLLNRTGQTVNTVTVNVYWMQALKYFEML